MTIEIVDIHKSYIPNIIDYWLNENNRPYHEARGMVFNEETINSFKKQEVILLKQAETPFTSRPHTTAIISINDQAIGHIILNHIKDTDKRRMHFHLWRHQMPLSTLSSTLRNVKKILDHSLCYFFAHFDIDAITIEIPTSNKPALFFLKRYGYKPVKSVNISSIGYTGPALQYIFQK